MNLHPLEKNPDIERIQKYIDSVKWQYAKTMPKHPHYYNMIKWNFNLADDFFHFVVYIRKHGYQEKFFKYNLTYLNIGEFKYWSMGNPLPETILINRAKIESKI